MTSPSTNSPSSFHTADETAPKRSETGRADAAGSGGAGSTETGTVAMANSGSYRPVKALPYELKDHARVFFEERMYSEAIQLLTSLLAAGGSERWTNTTGPSSCPPPVLIPPPSHLAVLATLVIHPAYTSRIQENTDRRVASRAMKYLRHILTVAGPVQTDMRTAFAFNSRGSGGRSGGRNGGSGNGNGSGSGSRSHSHPRRLRATAMRSASGGDSEYVDSRTLTFDDDKNRSRQTNAALAAAGISVDILVPAFARELSGPDGGAATGGDTKVDANASGNTDGDRMADVDADEDAVSGRMATRDSIWTRGQDFWRVVGWAMSCSISEPVRWRCWKPWLTLLTDVLEADLAARWAAQKAAQKETGDVEEAPLQQSLLCSYLQDFGSSHARLRHVAAAVLADGSQAAYTQEVFDKETVMVSDSSADAEMAAVAHFDFNRNRFGDYSDDESAPPSSTPLAAKTKRGKGAASCPGPGSATDSNNDSDGLIPCTGRHPGFVDSLPLRRRLFYLIVLASVCFPEDFVPSEVVFRTFAEVLRESEVTVFKAFVEVPPVTTTTTTTATDTAQSYWSAHAPAPLTLDNAIVGLFRNILSGVVPLAAPKPRTVDAETDSRMGVSQRMLERCYLPFAANTVLLGANVRMALVMESLFRIVWGASLGGSRQEFCWTGTLQKAIEAGIKARESRAKPSKKNFEVDAYGRDLMRRSGRRLLAMAQLAKMQTRMK